MQPIRYVDPRASVREAERKTEQTKGKFWAPVYGQIKAFDTDAETVQVKSPFTTHTLSYQHPHLANNSWLRFAPSANCSVLLQNRWDTKRWTMLKTSSDFKAERTTRYASGNGLYRPLRTEEFDIRSVGGAGIFGSDQGTLELSGGMVYGEFSNSRLEHWVKAPLHIRRMAYHRFDNPSSEERLGLAKRVLSGEEKPIRVGQSFAIEYFRELRWKGTPQILSLLQEGIVLDNNGREKTHPNTGNALRYLHEFGIAGGTQAKLFMDNSGNVAFSQPRQATDGIRLKNPTGKLHCDFGAGLVFKSQGAFELRVSDGIQMRSVKSANIIAPSVTLGATTQGASGVVTQSHMQQWVTMLLGYLQATVMPKTPFNPIVIPPFTFSSRSVKASLL